MEHPGRRARHRFVHPGRHEVSVLRQFETDYDGSSRGAGDSTPANEALAVAGLSFLADQVKRRKGRDALMLANHPARKGIDSPHEIRAWRGAPPPSATRSPSVSRAPPAIRRPASRSRSAWAAPRAIYDGSPGANSFPGYPEATAPGAASTG